MIAQSDPVRTSMLHTHTSDVFVWGIVWLGHVVCRPHDACAAWLVTEQVNHLS